MNVDEKNLAFFPILTLWLIIIFLLSVDKIIPLRNLFSILWDSPPCVTKGGAIGNSLDNKKALSKVTVTNIQSIKVRAWKKFCLLWNPRLHGWWSLAKHMTTIPTTCYELDWEEHHHKDRTQRQTISTDLMTWKLLNIAVASLSSVGIDQEFSSS